MSNEFEGMDKYQEFTNTTCQYPSRTHAISVTLGLLGETGEFAEKINLIADNTIDAAVSADAARKSEYTPPVQDLMKIYAILHDSITTGRMAEASKKAVRNKTMDPLPLRELTQEERLSLAKELGDIQWYVAQAARALGYNLSEIAQMNAEKLRSRLARGVIKGSGDER